MKLIFATFLLISLLLLSSAFLQTDAIDGPIDDAYCSPKCKDRCAKAGVQERCLKYCAICCVECKCVPSGTYGNKHECPCYRDKKNKKGQSKCP